MVVFKTCCCCLSLRTGCIVIGVLEILGQLSNISSTQTSISVVFGTIIGLIAAALLIYGAVKRDRLYMWPWIVVTILSIIFLIILVFLCALAPSLIMDVMNSRQAKGEIHLTKEETHDLETATTAFVVIMAVVFLIVIAILILLTLVVYSYICELREEGQRQQHDSNVPPKAYNLVPV